jgi:hypothetical protein
MLLCDCGLVALIGSRALSRCWTLTAGWPSQARSTRKLQRRGGHCIGVTVGRVRPVVVAQMKDPRFRRSPAAAAVSERNEMATALARAI